MTPLPPGSSWGPTSVYQPPTYDPYSQSASSPPSMLGAPPGSTTGVPATTTPSPYFGQPPAQPYYGQPQPGFGTQSPPVLYPNGLTGAAPPPTGMSFTSPLRCCQGWRLSETWVSGPDPGDLDINDIYTSVTMACPNFLWSGQPWYISPGFGLHLWSDPLDPLDPRVALPSRAYSAFVDLGWKSDPNHALGVELAARPGLFGDFDEIDSGSFRLPAVALLRYNLTPTLALKAGIEYLDRLDVELLPAGGLLWTPNPKTRWDIYFPQPKLASYLTTLGTREMWWYLAAEYGGGSWNILLDDDDPTLPGLQPGRTKMDINDYRVMLGLEWQRAGGTGAGQRNAFLEVGYVFEREVLFELYPDENYTLGETFMLRGGLSF